MAVCNSWRQSLKLVLHWKFSQSIRTKLGGLYRCKVRKLESGSMLTWSYHPSRAGEFLRLDFLTQTISFPDVILNFQNFHSNNSMLKHRTIYQRNVIAISDFIYLYEWQNRKFRRFVLFHSSQYSDMNSGSCSFSGHMN